MLDDPLRYHGDQAAHGADLDFAVNVHGTTPQWLQDSLATSLGELAAYPSAQLDADVRAAIAANHNRSADEVLLLHGVAEGFSLLPHLGLSATIVQPQFTEPEAAFHAAGVGVDSLVLPSPYTLTPTLADVHENASSPHSQQLDGRMVIIGNPTNPTGVAHSADDLRGLASRCGILVVDEAFMDVANAGTIQRCSLVNREAGGDTELPDKNPDNVIVFRSMTKTWAVAGLRCGYALGHPELLAQLARRRPHWPLGTLQLTAMAAIAQREEELLPEIRAAIRQQRESMTQLLRAAGWQVLDSEAPFVLARPGGDRSSHNGQGAVEVDVVKHERLRQELAERGVAVRRCDTFAGLDGSWWRLAVRDEASVRRLIAEVADLLSQN
ncbi:Rv2231c family pyridoxal phosphate-dependent protein CobC [Corynebacterium amycolatum]|uniref:Rv2231c family pyridoxal phosphate-dependent protein CobC n=1 Tax=Corynebacterium amycolatum TaxID=43765 RepID=UPI003B5A2FF6